MKRRCACEVLHYTFDNPSNRGEDLIGGHTATVNLSAATLEDGVGSDVGDKSIGFHVANTEGNQIDEVSAADASDLDIVGPMTVTAWIKPRGNHDGQQGCTEGTILHKGASNYWFQVSELNDFLELQNNWSGENIAFSRKIDPALTSDEWVHVAYVRNQHGRVTYFVNGGRHSKDYLWETPVSNDELLQLGNFHHLPDQIGCEFNGDIDEVRIFGCEVYEDQIGAEYTRVSGLPPAPDMPQSQMIVAPASEGWGTAMIVGGLLLTGAMALTRKVRSEKQRAL
jgi:hypothetical protein